MADGDLQSRALGAVVNLSLAPTTVQSLVDAGVCGMVVSALTRPKLSEHVKVSECVYARARARVCVCVCVCVCCACAHFHTNL